MYNKRESEVISFALSKLKNKYEEESSKIYENCEDIFNKTDKEENELERIHKITNEIEEIRKRFDLERNTKSWYKLIKRAFKRKLLRKITIWLSE